MQPLRPLFGATIVVGILANQLLPSVSLAQTPPTWWLVQEMKIDGNIADLTSIGAITQARNGDIFVAQPQDRQIKVFNSTGKFLRTIGHQGQGPGEFEGISNIGFVGDTLYAVDDRLPRITLFRNDGRLIRTIPTQPIGAAALREDTTVKHYSTSSPIVLLPNNRAFVMPHALSDALANGTVTRLSLYRTNWNGEAQKRVAAIPSFHMWYSMQVGSYRVTGRQPFSDDVNVVIATNGSRIALVSTDVAAQKIRIVDLSPNGDTLGTRTVNYAPQSIPTRYSDSIAIHFQGLLKGATIAEARTKLYLPKSFPAFSSALLGEDGTLWLRTSSPINSTNDWAIISAQGKVAATVTLPKFSRILSVVNGIWVAEYDADDVASVVHYRIDMGNVKHE
ncbi:MAG: 6-bladed beta-propeller [Gemmatimonadaceae bacterium]